MKVRSLRYNWHQVGSVQDKDGCGEDWARFIVGLKGVVIIEENEPTDGMQLWNYVVHLEDGVKYRIFNPNFVEYFKQ